MTLPRATTLQLLVVLAVVYLPACTTTDNPPAPTQTATTPTATTQPSPTPTPTPSPTYPDDGILPDNTGDDPAQAIRAIVQFRHHLFEVPNPTKVGLIYAKACPCFEKLKTDLQLFAERGYHITGGAPTIDRITITRREGSLATVRYSVTSSDTELRDTQGRVRERDEGGQIQELEADLVRSGQRWRIAVLRDQ